MARFVSFIELLSIAPSLEATHLIVRISGVHGTKALCKIWLQIPPGLY